MHVEIESLICGDLKETVENNQILKTMNEVFIIRVTYDVTVTCDFIIMIILEKRLKSLAFS